MSSSSSSGFGIGGDSTAATMTPIINSSGDSTAASASSIIAEAVSGYHMLTIKGYFGTLGLGTGKFVRSVPFTVGGHSWCIDYYPNGFHRHDADYISIFVRLLDKDSQNVEARFKISLLDGSGEPAAVAPSFSRECSDHLSSDSGSSCRSWGFYRFIERKALEKPAYSFWTRKRKRSMTMDDCLKVRCDITISKEIRAVDDDEPFVVVPPPDMSQHLGRLLSSGEGADVTFVVDGETVAAHRWLLAARSPVFKVELFGPMQEKFTNCIRIDDIEARVFKALLDFIYTDSLAEIDDGDEMAMLQHLLVAADRYIIERLKLVCEDKLCSYVDTGTVATMLVLAEQHNCQGLKRSCFKFLGSHNNLRAAMLTDGFEHLTSSCPSLLKELAKVPC
ncbi:hypothetical protein ACP70R_007666 [Stipagrostis hirtigluma subsp. patula]